MFDPTAGHDFTLGLAFPARHAKLEAKETPYMTIHLPQELESSIRAQVLSGLFASEDDMVAAAVRDYLLRHRQPSPPEPGTGSIGAMHDDAELLGQVTQIIMQDRQTRTLRLPPDE